MPSFLVLGFRNKGLDAVPAVIYSGTNGDDALAAVAKLSRAEWDDVREYRNLRQSGFRMRVPDNPVAPVAEAKPIKSKSKLP